jgi:MinD superfamily P-loop ATPase
MGALPPKYSFALNPHADYRATSCPSCQGKTRLRKIPLVIHVEGAGLLILRKTCRLCLNCEMVIAHQAEIESAIKASAGQATAATPDYLVLGTADPQVWRQGLSGDVNIKELVRNMADFKAHLQIKYTPGGWYPPT